MPEIPAPGQAQRTRHVDTSQQIASDNVDGIHFEAFTATWRSLLGWSSYWIVMAASFGLTAWLAGGSRIDAKTAYIMATGNMLMVAFLEQLVPRIPGNNLFRDRQSLNDIGHLLLFKFACRPLAWAATIAVVSLVGTRWGYLRGAWPTTLPIVAQFVILLLLFDLVGYAYHRSLHSVDRLFLIHALHHDTREVHMLKAVRVHFVEEFINFVISVSPFILIGVPPLLLTWLGMWNVFESNLAHSNVDQRFPRWMHYIIRTSGVHYIHHAADAELQKSNFGGLPIWDVVFRTFRHPADTPVAVTGIGSEEMPTGFLGQLWFPVLAQMRLRARREGGRVMDV